VVQFAIRGSGDAVIVLDTNVLSELMSSAPSETVRSWVLREHAASPLYTTSVTAAEILYGVELLPAGKRKDRLVTEAKAMFAEDFAGRVLSFDLDCARVFSEIATRRRRSGRPIAEFDAQIAAIAYVHGAVLASRNTADFEGCGVRVVNPWEEKYLNRPDLPYLK